MDTYSSDHKHSTPSSLLLNPNNQFATHFRLHRRHACVALAAKMLTRQLEQFISTSSKASDSVDSKAFHQLAFAKGHQAFWMAE